MERAVTYVRVSTEEEKQLNALSKQRDEAKQAIIKQGWQFIREYVDEGVTGTSTRKRSAYNQLFADLATNQFDVVVIKSQDRLMRNPKDWYAFLSQMLENGKRLYMYMENSFYKSDDSLITGIKAILAAEYSRELSKKLNLANKYRQERGSSIITNNKMLGYTQKDGELYIHAEEAKAVERIVQLYEQGLGSRRIAIKLKEEGYTNRRGEPISKSTIKRLPFNYAYEGTIVQNRQHTDFDTKRTTANDESEWIIHEDRCPTIISHERMEHIRKLVRSRVATNTKSTRGCFRGSYPLSGKIKCSLCGSNYRRVTMKIGGEMVPYWVCGVFNDYGRKNPKGRPPKEKGCDAKHVRESVIYDAIRAISDRENIDMTKYAAMIIKELKRMNAQDNVQGGIYELNKKLHSLSDTQSLLLDKLLDGTVPEDVFKRKNQEIEKKKSDLQDELNKLYTRRQDADAATERYRNLLRVITSNEVESEVKFNFILEAISKIVVYDDHMNIFLGVRDERYASVPFDNISECSLCSTELDTLGKNIEPVKIKLNLSTRFHFPYEAHFYIN